MTRSRDSGATATGLATAAATTATATADPSTNDGSGVDHRGDQQHRGYFTTLIMKWIDGTW